MNMPVDRLPADSGPDVTKTGLDVLDEAVRIDPALFERPADEPPFLRHVLTTPLHLTVAAESRTNAWARWNGYTTPDIYTNLDDEYRALRHAAAIFDHSPLVKYRIAGRDAGSYLARLVAGNVRDLPAGEARRVVFCEDGGYVLGDGILFRLDEDEYRLVTEETHLSWLTDSAIGFRVRIEDVTATLAVIGVQGPLATRVMEAAGAVDIGTLEFSTAGATAARWTDFGRMPAYVSRSCLSADPGYEIWADPEDAPEIWNRLMCAGAPMGLRPGGFALRELARIEAGIPRAGVDYLGAFAAVDPAHASTPFELGFASLVDTGETNFTGRSALLALRAAPPRHAVACLQVAADGPLHFSAICRDGRIAGVATSVAFSPALGANLALVVMPVPGIEAAGDTDGFYVEVEVRNGLATERRKLPARPVAAPFARATES